MQKVFSYNANRLICSLAFFMGFFGLLSAEKIAIIDAGSSGSRLYVYDIDANSHDNVRLLFPIGKKQKPLSRGRALSSVANHPDSVQVYLNQMTENFKGDSINLYIFATAGMRLKSASTADSIYYQLEHTPLTNGYKVKSAMTISGQYEGLYGWLAANFENGFIGFSSSVSTPMLTYIGTPHGIVEIGGASMQVAFKANSQHSRCLYRPGLGYVYSISYLGGGVDQIYKHTASGKKYNFNLDLKPEINGLYNKQTKFLGLGKPINKVLEGLDDQKRKKTYKGKMKGYLKSLKHFVDTPENYHPRMTAHYVKWISDELGLDGKIISPKEDATWTIGAAIDIAIHRITPEKYDAKLKN